MKIGNFVFCKQNGKEARTVIETGFINNERVMKVKNEVSGIISLWISQKEWIVKE